MQISKGGGGRHVRERKCWRVKGQGALWNEAPGPFLTFRTPSLPFLRLLSPQPLSFFPSLPPSWKPRRLRLTRRKTSFPFNASACLCTYIFHPRSFCAQSTICDVTRHNFDRLFSSSFLLLLHLEKNQPFGWFFSFISFLPSFSTVIVITLSRLWKKRWAEINKRRCFVQTVVCTFRIGNDFSTRRVYYIEILVALWAFKRLENVPPKCCKNYGVTGKGWVVFNPSLGRKSNRISFDTLKSLNLKSETIKRFCEEIEL